ncbi:MAG TPA: NUDIX domain-containing protein [archaeon]|nr:NUDIX domain-containing protein [archaeon]
MISEKSAGAILFRKEGETRLYLLLNYTGGHWDFPKGNIEQGEKEEETTKREIQEETGISDISFFPGFKEKIRYFYRREGQQVSKEVIYFLAETKIAEVKISWEHKGFEWLMFKDALERTTFNNSKAILKKAEEVLSGSKGLGKFLQK